MSIERNIALTMKAQDGSYTDAIELGKQLHIHWGLTIPAWIDKPLEDLDPSSDYREWIMELESGE